MDRNSSGLKAALGENPKGPYGESGKMPSTRMGNAAVSEALLYKARDYEKSCRPPRRTPPRRLTEISGFWGLLKESCAERSRWIHAHRADDIVTAVRIAEEFGIDFSIEHWAPTAPLWQSSSELRKAGVNVGSRACGGGPRWKRGTSPLKRPGSWQKAGCRVSIISDHPFHPSNSFLRRQLCWANGMPEEDALRAVTFTPAETLGVDDRVGSLDEGKDADFVVWVKSPLPDKVKVAQVFIGGVKVFG